ncbi:2-phospho-L-lactate transferase [Microbacterium sorbitolivorans]|uniref:2-phospho-L-lactate transferase n=1 Tax=Microbacterium sorbitolivorans TaxID=1867410 RepID=A0A367Y7R0_9MICO|nr:2-phospho-L-lactate transferase [Microbacterium sorbitolivorans]RCK61868.1 2-phospho-L-lactate transferase [Microbacterium sorbitolivorans]GGF45003.1 2-phospho-L-lactate transferase [Microbacterium sorbitolivorans]
MRITVIGGGVGCARFVLGLREYVSSEDSIDVVVNTADDWWVSGLRIAPDHDSLLYALAGVNDTVRGWGRSDETERVAGELHAWGTAPEWFTLGDLDLGTHIARTAWLRAGESVSDVYRRLGSRWDLGVTLHPATDTEIDTQVITDEGRIHFQEWWVKHRSQIPARGFEQLNIASAAPSEGAREAIENADVILLAPSNPVVSIGPVLAVPGMRDLLRGARAKIVGVSGIIDGSVVRGMADACLSAIGVETSARAVAEHYGARKAGGILDGWLVDETDAAAVDPLTALGIRTRAVPLWLRDPASSAQVARDAVALAR